jgi:hypothetical protein
MVPAIHVELRRKKEYDKNKNIFLETGSTVIKPLNN